MNFEHKERILTEIATNQNWINMTLSMPIDETASSEDKKLKEAIDVAAMTLSVCLENYRLAVGADNDEIINAACDRSILAHKILIGLTEDMKK
jgi:hypothetical protein